MLRGRRIHAVPTARFRAKVEGREHVLRPKFGHLSVLPVEPNRPQCGTLPLGFLGLGGTEAKVEREYQDRAANSDTDTHAERDLVVRRETQCA